MKDGILGEKDEGECPDGSVADELGKGLYCSLL